MNLQKRIWSVIFRGIIILKAVVFKSINFSYRFFMLLKLCLNYFTAGKPKKKDAMKSLAIMLGPDYITDIIEVY